MTNIYAQISILKIYFRFIKNKIDFYEVGGSGKKN
jgi:hypothetical protein